MTQVTPNSNCAKTKAIIYPEVTKVVNLPPANQGRVALGLTAAAAQGQFKLQVCAHCEAVQYPPREVCSRCLSPDLDWRDQAGDGELVSSTILRHSNNGYFQQRLPWRVGFVHLDAGPTLMAHVHSGVGDAPQRVRVGVHLDRAGRAALIAFPNSADDTSNNEDKMITEMTSNPAGREVLVTDGESALGLSLAKALIKAGAEKVWLGYSRADHLAALKQSVSEMPAVEWVALDVSNETSVNAAAANIATGIDIVINNAECHHIQGISSVDGAVVAATSEMEVNYLGLFRLAQAFTPALIQRATEGTPITLAWVNLLSIYALSNLPSQGTYSASKAAAYSLSQCLRAQLQPSGIRTVNVFPGPIDDQWSQQLPPPRTSASALAKMIINGLTSGIEDIYPDNVSAELQALWREDPKILERELSSGQ